MKHFAQFILVAILVAGCTGASEKASPIQDDGTSTIVIRDEDSPTGYSVIFRYDDKQAARVRVSGEWMFSDPAEASIITSTNANPFEWENGYTLWSTTSRLGDKSLPIFDMEKNADSGLWEFKMPLPCGTYKYKFYVGGEGDELGDLNGAQEASDPAFPPFHRDPSTGALTGEDTYSHIYVPYDTVRQSLSEDRSIEAPRDGENGTVDFVVFPSADGSRQLKMGVYLPYGYDASRAEKYPLFVVYHGGGGCESSWFNNGFASILDNMIAQGRMEPTVIVTPNGSDFRGAPNWDREGIDNALEYDIIPYVLKTTMWMNVLSAVQWQASRWAEPQ